MKLDLTVEHYQELIKKSYSLDAIFLLNLISEDYDITPLTEDSAKIKAIYKSLIRKGIITEEEKLTTLGIDLMEFISKKTNKKFIKKKAAKSDFDDWWEIYPRTDAFIMGTVRFNGTRGLRVDKEECRLAFNKIIDEGTISKEDIMHATLYDIKQRKSNSLKNRENQLTFLVNSARYLKKGFFEPFIDLSRDKENEIKPIIGSTDI